MASAVCLSAAGAAGVVRYILFGAEEGRVLRKVTAKDPEYASAVRELLADVDVNLQRLRRARPGPQRRFARRLCPVAAAC